MQLSKVIVKTLLWSIIGLVVLGVACIFVRFSTPDNTEKYTHLYVHYSENDSVSVMSQIESNERVLIIYFHPECIYCHGNLNSLAKTEMLGLVVNIVSYAPKDSVDALLKHFDFERFDEVNVVYDTMFAWNNKLEIKTIPTTLYFKDGKLHDRRSGYFKLEQILYE